METFHSRRRVLASLLAGIALAVAEPAAAQLETVTIIDSEHTLEVRAGGFPNFEESTQGGAPLELAFDTPEPGFGTGLARISVTANQVDVDVSYEFALTEQEFTGVRVRSAHALDLEPVPSVGTPTRTIGIRAAVASEPNCGDTPEFSVTPLGWESGVIGLVQIPGPPKLQAGFLVEPPDIGLPASVLFTVLPDQPLRLHLTSLILFGCTGETDSGSAEIEFEVFAVPEATMGLLQLGALGALAWLQR